VVSLLLEDPKMAFSANAYAYASSQKLYSVYRKSWLLNMMVMVDIKPEVKLTLLIMPTLETDIVRKF